MVITKTSRNICHTLLNGYTPATDSFGSNKEYRSQARRTTARSTTEVKRFSHLEPLKIAAMFLAMAFVMISSFCATAEELPFVCEINGFKVMECGRESASFSFCKPEKLYAPGEDVSFKIRSASDSGIRLVKISVSAKGITNTVLEREIFLERGKDVEDWFSLDLNGIFTVVIAFLDSEGR
ncbi:MAG: hypothetical protein EOM17_08245, partial [Synergistales bacterium]|nr:hypothetical protein [Synergistales bacterium]